MREPTTSDETSAIGSYIVTSLSMSMSSA